MYLGSLQEPGIGVIEGEGRTIELDEVVEVEVEVEVSFLGVPKHVEKSCDY